VAKVLMHVNETGSVLKMIQSRKHNWIGHILRHESFLLDIIEGKMLGKKSYSWQEEKRIIT